MPETKIYLQDDLEQTDAQDIIARLKRTCLCEDDMLLALLGYKGAIDSINCLMSTPDRLVYCSRLPGLSVHTLVILYPDLDSVFVKSTGKYDYICWKSKSGEVQTVNIHASAADTQKMLDFIQDYMANGTAYVEQRMQEEDFIWKVKAIRDHQNIRIAYLNYFHKQKQKMIDADYKDRMNRIKSSSPLARFAFIYCSGLGDNFAHDIAHLTFDQGKLIFEIKQENSSVNIPFEDIKSCQVTTEDGFVPNDFKNKYIYYVHVNCIVNGLETELVFARRQKQNTDWDLIGEFSYYIQHIGERIVAHKAQHAEYEQNQKRLLVERERLLAQRAGQAAEIRNLFSGGSPAGQPLSPQPAGPSTADPVEEIKKYKELLDQGILTQEEFDAKKKELFNL